LLHAQPIEAEEADMKKILLISLTILALSAGAHSADLGMMVHENYRYTNISTADNTAVLAAPGILAGILVNGGTMGQVTVYDNVACTVGGTVVATIASPYAGQVIPFGVGMDTGISIRTAAATNLTVIWKKR